MAKRKRKAPKRNVPKRRRKRKVVKRKAPKRKRRNRFGNPMVNELKKELMAPIGQALEETKGFEDKLKEVTSKLKEKEKVHKAAISIKEKLIADLKGQDDKLTTTKVAIKDAGIEGAKAFYAMIDASGINTKIGDIFKEQKDKALEKLGPAGKAMGTLFTLERLGKTLESL